MHLSSLSQLMIGYNCFVDSDQFELNGLTKLSTVVMGPHSFSGSGNPSQFRVLHCDSLGSISIDAYSFIFFKEFEIRNCSSLTIITVGEIDTYSASFYMSSVIIEGSQHSLDPN